MPVKVTLKSTNKEVSGNGFRNQQIFNANTGGQYLVKINVPASKDLLPGMFVNVQFPFKNSGNVNQDFKKA